METTNYLWMQKYSPKSLNELTFNPNITNILQSLSSKDDFPHLIFYGPDGVGKKTRIHAFLEKIYGAGIFKKNTETRDLKVNSTTIQYTITSSNFHIELYPSDSENHDKFIISKVIKESSSVAQIDTKSQKKFKVIVLLDADNLSKEAQAALRRTMEKYSKNCRIIMTVNSLSKIILPIASRCLALRIPSPTENEIKLCLKQIIKSEGLDISDDQLKLIIKNSDRNIRLAINSLQLTTLGTYSKNVFTPEYIIAIKEIGKKIRADQSANSLKNIRQLVSSLLTNGIIPEEIILGLTKDMVSNINNENKKADFIKLGAKYDNRYMNGSNKNIFHIEALIAGMMYIQAS